MHYNRNRKVDLTKFQLSRFTYIRITAMHRYFLHEKGCIKESVTGYLCVYGTCGLQLYLATKKFLHSHFFYTVCASPCRAFDYSCRHCFPSLVPPCFFFSLSILFCPLSPLQDIFVFSSSAYFSLIRQLI